VPRTIARAVLLNRLDWFDLKPQTVLDVGCGSGRALEALHRHYPRARLLGIDRSLNMLEVARRRNEQARFLQCDAAALPFGDQSVDLIFANLTLPWADPQRLLSEFARLLTPQGLLLLSTTGPGTLEQVRRAWRQVDDAVHVHASLDLQSLGDLVVRTGLREPVLDGDRVTLRYSGVKRLHEELRAVGAANAAGGRRRTLTGKARFAAYTRALRDASSDAVDVTLEFCFVQAWGPSGSAAADAQTASFRGIPVRQE
jgi:malonyl-CoA O-methyltransferase